MRVSKYTRRRWCGIGVGLITMLLGWLVNSMSVLSFGEGITFSVLLFGIGTHLPRRFDLHRLGVPDSEDEAKMKGPWSKDWELYCSRPVLETAFREGRELARFVKDEVGW